MESILVQGYDISVASLVSNLWKIQVFLPFYVFVLPFSDFWNQDY